GSHKLQRNVSCKDIPGCRLEPLLDASVDESFRRVIDEAREVVVRTWWIVIKNVRATERDGGASQSARPKRKRGICGRLGCARDCLAIFPGVCAVLRVTGNGIVSHSGREPKFVRYLQIEEPRLSHPMLIPVHLEPMESIAVARS